MMSDKPQILEIIPENKPINRPAGGWSRTAINKAIAEAEGLGGDLESRQKLRHIPIYLVYRDAVSGRNQLSKGIETDIFKAHIKPSVSRLIGKKDHVAKEFDAAPDPQKKDKDYDAMSTGSPTREEISSRIEASEARVETRLTQIQADFDLKLAGIQVAIENLSRDVRTGIEAARQAEERAVSSNKEVRDEIKLSTNEAQREARSTKITLMATIITSALAVVGLVIGIMTMLVAMQGNSIMSFQSGLSVGATAPAAPAQPGGVQQKVVPASPTQNGESSQAE